MVLETTEARRPAARATSGRGDYEGANIGYWTMRSASYSAQHRGELEGEQCAAWRRELEGRVASAFPDRRPDGLRVLDIGSGPGFFSILFAQMGCRVTGIDYTDSMLAEARCNACAQGCRVEFLRMNAEALGFADGTFDVVVSRNLTWNLPHPERALAEWARVLAPGGLLLNYDANWYAYLHDAELLCAHEADRANAARAHLRDRTQLGEPAAMEAIAATAPLTFAQRPDWDVRVLAGLGLRAEVDLRVSERVWTEEELVSQASTPLFCVSARKA